MDDSSNENIDRYTGYAAAYDCFRPSPPRDLPAMLAQMAGTAKPRLVVDLGSGTGLSTFIWSDVALEVVGIEPNADMRDRGRLQARKLPAGSNVRFEDGLSNRTDLPAACADIVTCSQSLHWMEPDTTLAEAARILRRGGVFAAYDCDWPPLMHPDAETAFEDFVRGAQEVSRQRGIYQRFRRWEKDSHLARIKAAGHFRYVREVLMHSIESGDAERLVGLALCQGDIAALLKQGFTAEELGVDSLRQVAERALGKEPAPWYFNYRIRLGIK